MCQVDFSFCSHSAPVWFFFLEEFGFLGPATLPRASIFFPAPFRAWFYFLHESSLLVFTIEFWCVTDVVPLWYLLWYLDFTI
jgi:hypothetical protein